MGPYTKKRDSSIIDGWVIEDGNGEPIAYLETALLANVVMAYLLDDPIASRHYTATDYDDNVPHRSEFEKQD